MGVDAFVATGRRLALDLMTDQCEVTRTTGTVVGADAVATPAVSPVYAGMCRLRPSGAQDRMVDTAGVDVGVATFVLSLPITVVGVEPGDDVVITASDLDPGSVGRRLVVLGAVHASQLTARRLFCQEVRP